MKEQIFFALRTLSKYEWCTYHGENMTKLKLLFYILDLLLCGKTACHTKFWKTITNISWCGNDLTGQKTGLFHIIILLQKKRIPIDMQRSNWDIDTLSHWIFFNFCCIIRLIYTCKVLYCEIATCRITWVSLEWSLNLNTFKSDKKIACWIYRRLEKWENQ